MNRTIRGWAPIAAVWASMVTAVSVPDHVMAAPIVSRISVEVDTQGLGEDGPVIERRIQERTDVLLRGEGVLPAEPGSDDPIIHVRFVELAGPDPGYSLQMWIIRGSTEKGARTRIDCRLCTESEVVARVERAVFEQLESFEHANAVPPPPPSVLLESGPAPNRSPAGEPMIDRVDKTGGAGSTRSELGRAGLAVGGVGVAGVIAGVILALRPAVVDRQNPLLETTTRPIGLALIGSAAGAIVGGTIMLLVERRRRHRMATPLITYRRRASYHVVFSQ